MLLNERPDVESPDSVVDELELDLDLDFALAFACDGDVCCASVDNGAARPIASAAKAATITLRVMNVSPGDLLVAMRCRMSRLIIRGPAASLKQRTGEARGREGA